MGATRSSSDYASAFKLKYAEACLAITARSSLALDQDTTWQQVFHGKGFDQHLGRIIGAERKLAPQPQWIVKATPKAISSVENPSRLIVAATPNHLKHDAHSNPNACVRNLQHEWGVQESQGNISQVDELDVTLSQQPFSPSASPIKDDATDVDAANRSIAFYSCPSESFVIANAIANRTTSNQRGNDLSFNMIMTQEVNNSIQVDPDIELNMQPVGERSLLDITMPYPSDFLSQPLPGFSQFNTHHTP